MSPGRNCVIAEVLPCTRSTLWRPRACGCAFPPRGRLKPANILLDGPSVVLADLGLCLDERSERLTATDEAVGARLYTAPENESGRNPSSDQRPADFYAFGKIVWACFAGSQPPARERQLERDWSLTAILNDERFDTLRQLQEQLLVLDPERRLNDWPHVIRTLEAFGSYVNDGAPTVRDCLAAANADVTAHASSGVR